MSNRWSFKKLIAEATAAQQAIVNTLKRDYFQPYGLSIRVVEVKPTRHSGTKEERIEAALIPLYKNGQVYHYQGGNCQVLEDELISRNPPHDDVKDALTNCVSNLVKPQSKGNDRFQRGNNVVFHERFGGRSH